MLLVFFFFSSFFLIYYRCVPQFWQLLASLCSLLPLCGGWTSLASNEQRLARMAKWHSWDWLYKTDFPHFHFLSLWPFWFVCSAETAALLWAEGPRKWWWPVTNHQRGTMEKAMATHSSTLAWKTPWTEEPGRLQSMGLRRVGHDWVTSLSLFTFMHWRRKWQPTPVFLPGESQGRGSLVGCRLWGHTESDTTEAMQQQQQHRRKWTGYVSKYLWNIMVIPFLKLSPVKTRRQTKGLLSL